MKLLQILLVPLLFCLVWLNKSSAQEDDSKSPPAKILPVTPEIEAALTNAMQGCPATGSKTHAGVNKNGVYTLTGDLFHNGQTNALIDNHDNIVIGEWKGREWKATAMINAAPNWKSPSFNADESWGTTTSTKPFWLLWLQGYPLLVVGSNPNKYAQDFSVLLLDPNNNQILDSCSSYAVESSVKMSYLIARDSARGNSGGEASYYYRIRNNKFYLQKSWGSYWPNNYPSSYLPYNYCTSDGKAYIIISCDNDLINSFECIVLKEADGLDDITLSNIGSKIPKTSIQSINYYAKLNLKSGSSDTQVLAYVFEKLTDLPRELYRDHDGDSVEGRIESSSKIKVTGSQEAVKLLSP